jgi:dUTP pyrophosphatase
VSAPVLRVKVLPPGEGLDLPAYATEGAAGMDLRSAVDLTLRPMQRAAVPTGLQLAVPDGYEAQVRPRSGLALERGLGMPNAPGTIDADYRGELKVLVINLGAEPVAIERGMRIAQLVVAPVARARLAVVDDLDATSRGSRGFGSTGV